MTPPKVVAPSASYEKGQNRFGRIYAPDIRDASYSMTWALRAMSRGELKRRAQAPRRGPTLTQIGPRCVKYSIATSVSAQPMHYTDNARVSVSLVEQPLDGHRDLYDWAQANDEWSGTNYAGTSVRAGMGYMVGVGLSRSYVWARTWDELVDYLSRAGSAPAILGIDWTEDMDTPKRVRGAYYIEPTGPVLGGHAICALWYDKRKDALKLQNTWGGGYGDDGIVYFRREYAQPVIFMWNGEAASYTERVRV